MSILCVLAISKMRIMNALRSISNVEFTNILSIAVEYAWDECTNKYINQCEFLISKSTITDNFEFLTYFL